MQSRRLHTILTVAVLALTVGSTSAAPAPAVPAPAVPALRQVSAGAEHTCAVTRAGAVYCWGSNTFGELGDGTFTARLRPSPVAGLGSGVASVSAGFRSSCAVKTSGAAVCWGDNARGQLGDGTTSRRLRPTPVVGLDSGVASISVGTYHSCAVRRSGAALCWGTNGSGAIGDGTTTQRRVPTPVGGLSSGVASITSTGVGHACAVRSSGQTLCWGGNAQGQLGDGTVSRRLGPVALAGIGSTGATVSAGGAFTCATTRSGAARCWGFNSSGQLGDGTRTGRIEPVPVATLGSGVAEVSTGKNHACALRTGGAVLCWGSNNRGQLGDGSTSNQRRPTTVLGLSAVASVSAGYGHSCVVRRAGDALCWGDNRFGQIGDGTTADRLRPTAVR